MWPSREEGDVAQRVHSLFGVWMRSSLGSSACLPRHAQQSLSPSQKTSEEGGGGT
jgi:hypothetical protein